MAACGGDDGLTATEWRQRANAICARGNEDFEDITIALFGHLEPGERPNPRSRRAEDLFDFSRKSIRGQIRGIARLDPPERLEDEADDFVATARRELAAFVDRGPAVVASEDDPFEQTTRKAEELGLSDCAA